jgi:hypothetical protein
LTARQRSWATSSSLNAIASPAARDPEPLLTFVRRRTVAKVYPELVVLRWIRGGHSAYVRCDHRAHDHGLARPRRSDKHTQIVTAEGFYSALLWPGQCCCERELLRIAGRPFVGQLKATADLLDQRGNCVGQAARSRRPSSTRFVVAAQKPWCVPGGHA